MNRTNYLPSLFKGMFTNESRSIEWSEVAEMICGGSLESSTEKYRKMIANNLDKDAQRVKQWMPALCPVVQCNGGRRRQNFVGLTGVGMCDFDHLADVDGAFQTASADPHAFLVYRTISGNGVRVLFRVEFNDPEAVPDIQKYRGDAPGFAMANEYFSKLLGAEADMKCKNIGRLSVLCHDAEAVLRMDAVPFVVDLDMPANVKSTSLKRAVRVIEQHLADEGLEYAEGSYNEYVMRTGYYLNALGVAKENAVTWAIEQFNDYDKEQVRSIINSCYTHTDEFATLSIHALCKKRQQKETTRYASVEDIENFLSSVAQFRFNVITRKNEIGLNYELRSVNYDKLSKTNNELHELDQLSKTQNCELSKTKDNKLDGLDELCKTNHELRGLNQLSKTNNELDGLDEFCKTNNELRGLNQFCKTNNSSTCSLVNLSTYRELTDRDVNSLWIAMSKTGVNVKLQHIYSVICSNFVPRWNPFEEYFYSLPEWDGTTDYIARVASMVTVNFSTTNYTNLTNLEDSLRSEGVQECRSADNSWTSNSASLISNPSSSSRSEGVPECRSADDSWTSDSASGLTPNPTVNSGSEGVFRLRSTTRQECRSADASWTSNPSSQNSHQSSNSSCNLSTDANNSSTRQLVYSSTYANNSSTFTHCFRKWLVGMVAGLLDENVVNNTILVFVGKQGIYKTTFFNNLLPPELQKYFFTKTNSDRMTKDDKLSLAEFALICLEEIDSMKSCELNQLKALITTKTISERAAYERFKEGRRHIASFCGTGNNIRFLTDSTGNRRWLPFEIINIDEPKPEKYHYEGLYSQALALWRSGFRYWFNQEEIAALVSHVANFEVTSTEEELLLSYFRKPLPNEQCLYLTCSNIVEKINIYTKKPLSPILVGRALRKHGFESVHNRKGTFYSIVEYSGAEIAMNKRFTESSSDDCF